MRGKIDILTRIPREIAYQVAEHFSPKEYIAFCRVSKKWADLLHTDSLAKVIIRKHFSRSSDLVDYKDVEDRFSVLRNLAFRDHARHVGLVMKTKSYSHPNSAVRPRSFYSGKLAFNTYDFERSQVLQVLDLDRKSESPPKLIFEISEEEVEQNLIYWEGPGFILQIQKDSEIQAIVSNYAGEVIDRWCLTVPGDSHLSYLFACTGSYVVIRLQYLTCQLVHYEVWDEKRRKVNAYDIGEDLLSAIGYTFRIFSSSSDLDMAYEIDEASLQDLDLGNNDYLLRIQEETQTIVLVQMRMGGRFFVQRLSFASETKLEIISEINVTLEHPPWAQIRDADGGDDVVQFAIPGPWSGVMIGTNNPDDLNYINVNYVWYDHNGPQDGVENIRLESWAAPSLQNPSVEESCESYFRMGSNLYGIAPSPHTGLMLRHLKPGGGDWDHREFQLEIPIFTWLRLLSDDRYAVLAWDDGMLVLEWHDFDSWWESQVQGWELGKEVRHEFWRDAEESLANFRHESSI